MIPVQPSVRLAFSQDSASTSGERSRYTAVRFAEPANSACADVRTTWSVPDDGSRDSEEETALAFQSRPWVPTARNKELKNRTVAVLIYELGARNLSKAGLKDELIERLEAFRNQHIQQTSASSDHHNYSTKVRVSCCDAVPLLMAYHSYLRQSFRSEALSYV